MSSRPARRARIILTVVTLAFLVIQLGAIFGKPTFNTWPVGRSGFYTRGGKFDSEVVFRGKTGSGKFVYLFGEDLGLRMYQLQGWVRIHLLKHGVMHRPERMSQIADVYDRAHPDDRIVRLELWRRITRLSDSDDQRTLRVLVWRAPADTG